MKSSTLSTLNSLTALSLENPHKFKLAAAIYRRNRNISYGFNSEKTHPFQAKWGKNSKSIYLHAEISAIKQALQSEESLVGLDLYVARTKNLDGDLVPALARPCDGCLRAAQAFGLRRIIYTMDDGMVGNIWLNVD